MSRSVSCTLKAPGWNDHARRSLEQMIERGAGQGLPVVFDFDNTLISGDVGEAVLAILAAEGRLTTVTLSKSLSPVFRVPGKTKVTVEQCCDIMEYYEALLAPTAHGAMDPAPLANGYIWATQAMEGMTVAEVVAATTRVYEIGLRPGNLAIEVTPGKTIYPAPRFREQMVELIAELRRFKYEVWIVSASNVWSVRWMVLYGLNPLLRAYGIEKGLDPHHVIGVATLMADPLDRLYKDSLLLKENPHYAAMQSKSLKTFRLTRHLQFTSSVYSGKVACILDAIGRNPYFCAGDNPSDHPMMRISKHRLWIARLEKPKAQQRTTDFICETGKEGWILQVCSDAGGPHFLTELDDTLDSSDLNPVFRESATILRRLEKRLSLGRNGSRRSGLILS